MAYLPDLGVIMVGCLLVRLSFTRRSRQSSGGLITRIAGMVIFAAGIFLFLKTAGVIRG